MSALISTLKLRALRLAYLAGESAAWHGLIPDAVRFDLRTGGTCIPTRWEFTRAIRIGILDGCMYRDAEQRGVDS
jgi:hypothetical protein